MQPIPLKRILCVDDDEQFVSYLRALLENIDIQVHTALSAKDALQMMQEGLEVELLVIDIKLPDLPGYELVEKIQATSPERNYPFIFVTSLKGQKNILKSYHLGALDFICKPIEPKEFTAKISSLMNHLLIFQDLQRDLKLHRERFSKLEQMLYASRDGLIEVNYEMKLLFANPAALRLLELPVANYFKLSLKDILSQTEVSDSDWQSMIANALKNPKRPPKKIFWRLGNNQSRQLRLKLFVAHNHTDRYFIQINDNTSDKGKVDYLKPSNTIDLLTGLANHGYFSEHCGLVLEQYKTTKRPVGLILVNIERFSSFNQRFGHSVGDIILKKMAIRIRSTVREFDLVSRFGNDEFAILVDKMPHFGITQLVSNLVDELKRPLHIEPELEVKLNCNFGIAMHPESGDSFSLLYQSAKIALAKSQKDPLRNYHFYNNELDEMSRFYTHIVELFDVGFQKDEFYIKFQPQYDLKTGKMIGAEVLVRWQSATQGEIPPAIFIPIAEESNYIFQIGEMVIEKALREIAELKADLSEEFRLALNLSTKQLNKDNVTHFKLRLYESLQKFELPNSLIELEITEHSILSFDDQLFGEIAKLRSDGFSISLDDFGTGFSSLTYVQRLPLDRIKIDISFVRMIGIDKKSEKLIRLIINMSHSLQLQVIAEGVETVKQMKFLQKYHCDIGQGYLFAKPLGLDEFKSILNQSLDCFKATKLSQNH